VRILLVLVLILGLAAGAAWVYAGRGGPPVIAIEQPEKFVGRAGTVAVAVTVPAGELTTLEIAFEQDGQVTPLFSLANPGDTTLEQQTPERLRVSRPLGRAAVPQLKNGPGRITVRATRSGHFGVRELSAEDARDVQVRLDPPRVAVLSTFHFVNHGAAEAVIFRATPADVTSSVRVGDRTYPSYPLSGAGVEADPELRLAFFALLYDQDLNTPIDVIARDEAGNQATASVGARAFPKTFRRSRIEITPQFLQRVVPAILDNTHDFDVPNPDDLLDSFLRINEDLRRKNNDQIASMGAQTVPQILWDGAFQQLGNSKVESLFADHRTYFYQGKEIDQQVHLGFDLAVTARIPIVASNRGRVVFADYLGIYGNCVILDHGMGVQSLYAHLSSIDVKPGDMVDKGHTFGRSGLTGLAGGDHLHFTVLVNGHPVNAVEWWDARWLEDRLWRKVREAAPAAATTAP
jgi:murein DD-endopeptidase MepM/ murein hydrolase activator NlpD